VVQTFLATLWLVTAPAFASDSQIAWHPKRFHDVVVKSIDGGFEIEIVGNDPYLVFDIQTSSDIRPGWRLAMEVFSPEGIEGFEAFAGTPTQSTSRSPLPKIPASEKWSPYSVELPAKILEFVESGKKLSLRLDLGSQTGKRLSLRSVCLRAETELELEAKRNAAEIRNRKQSLADQIQSYYKRSWPSALTNVSHRDSSFVCQGKCDSSEADTQWAIIARAAHEIAAVDPTDLERRPKNSLAVSKNSNFEVLVSASELGVSNALIPRFQLVRRQGSGRWEIASSCRYVDQLDPNLARPLPPLEKLHAAKGLTCIGEGGDWEELGLKHGSINIALNHLISFDDNPGMRRTVVHGREVFYNPGAVASIDERVTRMRAQGITVAGILLIFNRPESSLSIVHPEADPAGTYVMPNLVDPNATDLYEWTIRFLADRYSQVDEPHGRIDHWIVHNEIDAGWDWTNMGEQPMEAFVDHYFRSLRIVDAAVRMRNPHARAFISLTHHWNSTVNQPWRWYPSRQIVESLVRHGEVEGNFPWAMAYHPYPQSLWKSDTWNDEQAEDTFDTPKITIRNLPVLDRYLHQPQLRAPDGSVRSVICSEQGFHSPEDSPELLRQQSAALLYTFMQMRKCPSIIAFDYHRPVDHLNEGGLRLGLRGLPSDEFKSGKPKPAWDVYRAIGTPQESELQAQYQSFWNSN
jgi:Family of unknown function (DUF5722)